MLKNINMNNVAHFRNSYSGQLLQLYKQFHPERPKTRKKETPYSSETRLLCQLLQVCYFAKALMSKNTDKSK